ncbi:MAG: S41 family peptidase [Phycisphaerales bacterium]|nr:MAG: S41 family peptidase [Phycisphaerales bacterium]
MKRSITRCVPMTLAVCAMLATAALSMGTAVPNADSPVQDWSKSVWETALRGDGSALKRYLDNLPADVKAEKSADTFRNTLQTHQQNLKASDQQREEAREKAYAAMLEHMEDGDISGALRKAVEVQTLSDRLEDAFHDENIQRLIDRAKKELPRAKSDGNWLLAQELLFRVRTLYDDTELQDEYREYDRELQLVNQRVALISRYAPRELHQMRNAALKRQGEEPLGEFNPATATDWRERAEGIDFRMLRESLRVAAREHIEGDGWRPLLEGGLRSLKLLATTNQLEETFSSLNNRQRVEQWNRAIEKELDDLRKANDRDLDNWYSSRLLGRLSDVNKKTLELEERVIYREFGDGAMRQLDEFTEVIWPDALRRFRQATEGNFVGVGILIRHNDKREIEVVNPLEGTPAYFAGIKPDDQIVEVDGESTVGWSLNDAVDRITGPKGETVTLAIRRDGYDEMLVYEIVRDNIKLHSVRGWWKTGISDEGDPEWDWFIDPVSRIGYVRVTSFNEETYNDLRNAWREMNRDGSPQGLILDLRYNPGGLLTSAVRITNLFLSRGSIVSGERKNGITEWNQIARPNLAEFGDVPTVVIINKGAASGSEIVAGALQAHGAAVVLGERSFGKGSVQTVHQVAPNAALKLTTQYYRLPPASGEREGRLVHRREGATVWGVDPDIEVRMTPSQVERSIVLRQEADIIPQDEDGNLVHDHPDRPHVNELLTKGLDPQVSTALLILQARALGSMSEDQRHAARRD